MHQIIGGKKNHEIRPELGQNPDPGGEAHPFTLNESVPQKVEKSLKTKSFKGAISHLGESRGFTCVPNNQLWAEEVKQKGGG